MLFRSIHYNLNSFWTKLSIAFSTFEDVEVEQLYVRYSPIPFYHTIDLYTLFLSLIQSPMILTYLKYCQRLSQNDDSDIDLDQNLFWRSFKDMWVDAEDIDTILGYYDFLYKKPTAEDQSTISFILDPIKKNPISLVKSVSNEYWERAWNSDDTYKNWDEIKPILDNSIDDVMQRINLSAGSITRMPNICLTDKCDSFKMRIHRNGTVF